MSMTGRMTYRVVAKFCSNNGMYDSHPTLRKNLVAFQQDITERLVSDLYRECRVFIQQESLRERDLTRIVTPGKDIVTNFNACVFGCVQLDVTQDFKTVCCHCNIHHNANDQAEKFWPIQLAPATASQVLSTYGHSVAITLKEFALYLNMKCGVQGHLDETTDSDFFTHAMEVWQSNSMDVHR